MLLFERTKTHCPVPQFISLARAPISRLMLMLCTRLLMLRSAKWACSENVVLWSMKVWISKKSVFSASRATKMTYSNLAQARYYSCQREQPIFIQLIFIIATASKEALFFYCGKKCARTFLITNYVVCYLLCTFFVDWKKKCTNKNNILNTEI